MGLLASGQYSAQGDAATGIADDRHTIADVPVQGSLWH